MFLKPPLTTFFLLLLSQTFQPADSRNTESTVLRLSPAKIACLDSRITGWGYSYISTDPEFEYLRTINLYSPPPNLQGEILTNPLSDHSAWATPECILSPRSAAEVSSALKAITAAGAPFAVRSGGHSPNLGWANIEGGVLVELSRINEITYDPANTNVVVGTGSRWGGVYSALEAYGRTAVGARVSPVGVGGFLLGGGLSHVSNEYGFGCDNVVEYEVVLANGTIVNANADAHPELYWALKGGTSNFGTPPPLPQPPTHQLTNCPHAGIVTRFTLKTIPMSKIWGGVITYNATQAVAVMDAIHAYHAEHISDLKSAISVQFILNAGVVLVTLMYAENVGSSPAAFAPFEELPHVASSMGSKSFVEFHDEWLVGDAANRYVFREREGK
ncbi:unnamed protein product [Tuber melanosporum]|uniref:(Perigord truffle) hypothetical protein n=1 Tax=Tuber melanosporum (strain Mel28) TaxID=656061 RepID=D5GB99_TUBMM|nr:uncharacterized protein GSTUM_00000533001 [Tuber melanosporum]CAZ81792.1 unnamed protein product [Tuber melanosporum]